MIAVLGADMWAFVYWMGVLFLALLDFVSLVLRRVWWLWTAW